MSSIIKPLEESRVSQIRSSCSGHSDVWDKFVKANNSGDLTDPHLDVYDPEWWVWTFNRDRVAFTFMAFIDNNCDKLFSIERFVPKEWIDDVKLRILDVQRFKVHHRPTNHSKW